jgi:hypothetical protein
MVFIHIVLNTLIDMIAFDEFKLNDSLLDFLPKDFLHFVQNPRFNL